MDRRDILLEPLYTTQQVNLGEFPTSPVQQIKARARRESEVRSPTPAVFCELLELSRAHEELYYWKEKARWIKFEETVEKSGKRWSKPHIPLVNAMSVFQLRNCIKRGAVLLDIAVDTYIELIDQCVRAWEQRRDIGMEQIGKVTGVLMRNKQHLVKVNFKHNLASFLVRQSTASSINKASLPKTGSNSNLWAKPPATPTAPTATADELEENEDDDMMTPQTEQLKKYLENAESAILLVGRTSYIDKPVSAFVRLKVARTYATLSEAPVPTRFVFILLAPLSHSSEELESIGRCLGALMIDPEYQQVAYYATDVADLSYGIDAFMRDMVMIPPRKWPMSSMLEPNESTEEAFPPFQETQTAPHTTTKMTLNLEGLQYTGKIFGGLRDDINRRLPFYISDFTDPFKSTAAFSQVLAGTTFLFFAQLTNLIAFGGMMGTLLNNDMAVIECLVACVFSGIVFALFSGQPLCIMGATGPVLIFEALFHEFCTEHGWSFLVARFWLMLWGALILLTLVALDASFLVAYITRFTEETFAVLIALVFIVESFEAIMDLGSRAPFTRNPKILLKDPCICNASLSENGTSWAKYTNMTGEECLRVGGTHNDGLQCSFKPDIFAFSLLLFLGSFLLAMWLQSFKNSQFFTRRIRGLISDFSLLLSLLVITSFSYFIGIPVPTLKVPHTLSPTNNRSWFVNPMDLAHWWIPLACIPPSLLLVMLVVMDQQITTVILNRKENMLRKGFGYHLDLLVVAILMIVCAIIGIPCMLSATILSLTHMRSLRMESEVVAPGEKPLFLGVSEQRVSPLVAHILIAFSIYLSPVEDLIPVPGLLGIFLYMGVSCLVDLQFFHRMLLYLTPSKHQPNFNYLRLIPSRRVHWFTLIQLIALGLLLAVNYVDQIEMFFPVMLVVLVIWRKLLDWLFTPRELCVLDDPLPPWKALKAQGGSREVEVEGGVDQDLLRAYGKTNTESYIQ